VCSSDLIGLAQALINDPDLMFMDEPTAGLDPIAHIDIRRLILDLRAQGKTVFISSHMLEDVEEVCDRVAILNRGKLITTGRLSELLHGGTVDIIADNLSEAALGKVKPMGGVASLHEGRLVVELPNEDAVDQVVDIVRAEGGHLVSITAQRKKLEDLFVEAVGKEAR
jgi:ABC-2 type transport system ATP-binding protein